MAVTVNLYYSGVNGNARKFAQEMTTSGIVSAIRAEDGNLWYEYFFPMEDEKAVLLIGGQDDLLAGLGREEESREQLKMNPIGSWIG